MLTETIEAGRVCNSYNNTTRCIACYVHAIFSQEKCIQYWPALMDTPWVVGGNLSITLQSQTQYAAYRVKKILLENVSPKMKLLV